ncbi:hypothetical protein FLA_3921 [Filimonas lacunae]|nr:hypothetical protein FLA_3921 [Filimonas lacunae]
MSSSFFAPTSVTTNRKLYWACARVNAQQKQTSKRILFMG